MRLSNLLVCFAAVAVTSCSANKDKNEAGEKNEGSDFQNELRRDSLFTAVEKDFNSNCSISSLQKKHHELMVISDTTYANKYTTNINSEFKLISFDKRDTSTIGFRHETIKVIPR